MLLSIRRLSIEHFRGVQERQLLDFTNTPPGLYFVRGVNSVGTRLGSNGSGKSTIFSEATIWALTGRTSRSQRPGASVENRSAGGKTTSVLVEFAFDSAVHTVERTRNPNDLLLDGKKVEQLELNAVLPISDAALRKSILIDQFGEMFLSLGPEDKSKIFTEALNLDKWLRASDAASGEADSHSKKLQLILRRQEGNSASLAEVRDQHERARLAEESFETDLAAKVALAAKQHRQVVAEAKVQREALDKARASSVAIGDTYKVVEMNDQETKLRRLRHAATEAAGQLAIAERDIVSADDQLTKYKEAALLCPECGQPVGREHIKEKRQALVDEIEHLTKLRSQYVDGVKVVASHVEKAEAVLLKLRQQLEERSKALSQVALCAERSIAADREMHRLSAEVDKLEKQTNPFTKQCDELEAHIAELRELRDEFKAEVTKTEKLIAMYQFWQKGFREIRLQLIDSTLIELELAANRHAESLGLEGWRIEFATERETKKGTLSHRFTVKLYPPDEGPVDWETYCGGEVQRWQLATTFGLAEVLLARSGVTPDFEILDEPTSHLSSEGIDELLACLSDRAYELNRRIFLIDHNSLDRGSFDGIILIGKTAERGSYVADSGGVIGIGGELKAGKVRKERVVL